MISGHGKQVSPKLVLALQLAVCAVDHADLFLVKEMVVPKADLACTAGHLTGILADHHESVAVRIQ